MSYMSILPCLMCGFKYVLCLYFSVSHLPILACLMCLFDARLMCPCALGSLRSPALASLAWLASLAEGASRPQRKHVIGFNVTFGLKIGYIV